MRLPHITDLSAYFNPRSHEGSDDKGGVVFEITGNFNPRSHEGSDYYRPIPGNEIDISIHAPTRGATEEHKSMFAKLKDFNPRSHEGSDGSQLDWEYESAISIHAPTRGATATLTNFFFYNQSIFC